jgi:hypothetical protein
MTTRGGLDGRAGIVTEEGRPSSVLSDPTRARIDGIRSFVRSSSRTSGTTRWRAKSQYTPLYSAVSASFLSSSFRSSRRCVPSMISSLCRFRASHSGVVEMSAGGSPSEKDAPGAPRVVMSAPRSFLDPSFARLDISVGTTK